MLVKPTTSITYSDVAAMDGHTGGDYSVEQLVEWVNDGAMKAIYVIDNNGVIVGCLVYNILPTNKAFIFAAVGKHITTKDNWRQFIEILRNDGVIGVEAAMRDSVLRLWNRLGFVKKYNIAEVSL